MYYATLKSVRASIPTLAEPGLSYANIVDGVNSSFLLLTAALVFCMQAGFAMITVGSVRKKNARHSLTTICCDPCVGGVAYYVLGWGFAFDPVQNFTVSSPSLQPLSGITYFHSNGFIAYAHFALGGMQSPLTNDGVENGATLFLWWFQFTFCLTAASIVAGAIAERVRIYPYMGFVFLMMGFVYPVISHAMWDENGWLNVGYKRGTDSNSIYGAAGSIDFAGSGVVHITGGAGAFVGAIIIGPRIGRFDENGKARPMPAHNASLAVLGGFLLWFGWFGFNPGSQLGTLGFVYDSSTNSGSITTEAGPVALAAINTLVLPAACGWTTLLLVKIVDGSFDCVIMTNGFVCGLVVVTAPCSTVPTYSALCIGIIGAFVYFFGNKLVVRMGIDDPLEAIAVHAFGGTWGVLSCGFFSKPDYVAMTYGPPNGSGGVFYGYGKQLAAQVTEILYIWGFVSLIIGSYFLAMKFLGVLRVSPEEELAGVDVTVCGGHAYPDDDAGIEEDMDRLRQQHKDTAMGKTEGEASSSDSPTGEEVEATV
ncbi:hypothetical protein CDCA_CDCA12G3415 [Cyanidium caldarium]|uniref:Ammonium transporter AmtB-like domain-containing protein n=1 Tax=Cyanidium caldarium TaxID=2771 RepID=A0AAV9IZ99_CYACA|nr:hypothetical protein CDCA_CDCA12G3415 [Cyanidium caldarium]